ncbi:MAG: hypothetical protein AAGB32_04510 [Pseudomonadota bacterium]
MKKIFLISACAMVVSACATFADGQVQEVTIRTPGAENARCWLNNGDNLYDAYSGQTILVKRNNSDIVVNCLASGNREKTVRGKWSANEWIWLNVANGVVPGMTYDIFSQAAYEYPKDITVDFTDEPITAYSLPLYSKEELKHNSEYNTGEYMGPTTIDAPEDNRFSTLLKKDIDLNQSPFEAQAASASEPAVSPAASDETGAVYTKPVISYDPKEEEK